MHLYDQQLLPEDPTFDISEIEDRLDKELIGDCARSIVIDYVCGDITKEEAVNYFISVLRDAASLFEQ